MNGKQLRNSILQWAISGRLVPQCPTDEPGIELLKRINPKATPITEEVPFSIPDSWCWVKLCDVFTFINGDRGKNYPAKSKLSTTGTIPFISAINMDNYTIKDDGLMYVDKSLFNKLRGGKLQKNDFVLCIRGSLGKFCIYPYETGAIASSLVILRKIIDVEDIYISAYLSSSLFFQEIKKYNNGTAQPNLGAKDVSEFLFPLPPLAEQERIVGKVEELLPLVERYDKAQTELDRLNASLKGKLRASVLQEAISGRLVPQDPADEPASELLKRINPKFTPQPTDSPLPPGWTACRLEDIVEIKDNLRQPINSAERNKRIAGKKDSELYPYYGATGQVGYIDKYLMDGKYLLLGEDGAPFLDKMATKAYIVEGKCWVNNHAHVLLPNCNTEYMCIYLNQFSYYGYVTGSTRLKLTQASMKKMPVLVPPLAEQERIVGKVEELFAVLDALQ